MIPALSFLINPLAPSAATPVTGDPAVFSLLLAGVAGAAVGRQTAAPTGNAVPVPADVLLPISGSPIPLIDDEIADAPAPVPPTPSTLTALPSRPAIATPRPTAWPRFAKPEICRGPANEPPTAYGEAADPASAGAPTPIGSDAAMTIDWVAGPAGREQEAGSDPQQAPDLALTAAAIPTIRDAETRSRADASGRSTPTTRSAGDGPRSSIPAFPQPAPVASDSPIIRLDTPVVSAGRPASDVVDERTSPIPTLARRADPLPPASVTARAHDVRPIDAYATDRVPEHEAVRTPVAPLMPPAPTDRPAPVLAADPAAPPSGRATDAAPLPVPPPRFTGSPFRPPPEIATPTAASPPATPATVVSANPVVGQAAFLPVTAAPVEQPSPSSEPRPDAASPASDRPPAAPIPIAGGASTPTIARASLSGPARQVFAADLRRTGRDLRPVAGETLISPMETGVVGTSAAAAPVVAPLDLRQDRWPFQMVERIERLRDAVESERIGVDTRIRLLPDALGSIDVSVKRDGDTVHVHFTAEQAATRALLGDAAQRLLEAAEARGLKLGQTAVGGDGAQPNGRQPQQNTAPVPARPRSAAADEEAADTRIA